MAHIPSIASQHQQLGSRRSSRWIGLIIWTLVVLAGMRPQWLGEPVAAQNEARELMIAVDLSGSMEIADMAIDGQQVDRLTMLKHVMHDFIDRRVGDRLGLILFADTAYVQAPMTFDRNTVKQMLDRSEERRVGNE